MINPDSTTVLDFETKKIEKRPSYPPRPVGVALLHPSKEREYLAWGHPSRNNTDITVARKKLAEACRGNIVMHNSAFDMDILDVYFHLRPKDFDDTLYLAFLNDPRQESLSLKDLAHAHLGMPPDEQSELRDWILENIKGAKRAKKKWGQHIGDTPGDMTEPYAIGDVVRTGKLYKKFSADVTRRKMTEAYQREKDLTWVTLEMERSGVRVDIEGLNGAMAAFEKLDERIMYRMRKRLRVSRDFNFNSRKQLGQALKDADLLDAIIKTPRGGISTKIDSLKKTCNDQELIKMMSVHSVVEKYLNTFVRPWISKGEESDGRILPTFNQVRGRNDRSGGGTRTGRYSSEDPNLQQVAVNVEESKNKEILELLQRWLVEECDYHFSGLRDFILPDEGMVICSCDYDQQELRLLGHFEEGKLCEAYRKTPNLDVHDFVRKLVRDATGADYPRKFIKTTNFGLIYGMGVGKLAAQLGIPTNAAAEIKDAILSALPGVKKLTRRMREYDDMGEPFRTWGGREYYTEDPKEVKGEMRNFGYKNVNTIIQGSAADVTKEGMLQVTRQVPEVRIALQLHDELVVMVPKYANSDKIVAVANRVAAAMCDVKNLRVPMSVKPKLSTRSWGKAA